MTAKMETSLMAMDAAHLALCNRNTIATVPLLLGLSTALSKLLLQ